MADVNLTAEQMMLSRAAEMQRPVSGSLELLPLCNMNCDMCYIRMDKAEVDQKGGLVPAETWIQMGREMARTGVLFLLLTGGEPLLFPDFRKLYMELKRIGMILTVNTNGSLIDEEWADFFSEHKPRRINITLYGADNDAYEKLCHYPGGFSKTIKAVQTLRKKGVDVKINGSVTRYNFADMEAVYQIGRQLNVPVHMDTYMLPGIHERGLPFDKQSRLLPEEAALAEIKMRKAEMLPNVFGKYAEQIISQIERKDAVYPDWISCLAGNCSFAVSWNGWMRPCVTFEKPAVSVLEKGFVAAWQEVSRKAKKLRLSEICVRCPLRPICKTCVASAYLETGSYDSVPEYLCRYTKEYARLIKENVYRS